MTLRFLLIFYFSIISLQGFSQISVYQDIFKGGITGDAYNPWLSSTPGQFDIYIEPGSSIRKALLFINATNNPLHNEVIIFNGTPLTINQTFTVSPLYLYNVGSIPTEIKVLLLDVTNQINPLQNSYSLSIPQPQFAPNGVYVAFYLYVAYENPILNNVCALATVNNVQPNAVMNYSFQNINPVDVNQNIGLAMHGSDFCDTITDGSFILIEGDTIGLLGGVDDHSPASCSGIVGSFYYQNNTMFGLGNDTANTTMYATDGIANIESHLTNNSSINISYLYQSPSLINRSKTNPVHQLFLTYTTPCDTFTTTATTNQDTVCAGENIQLNATGGVEYSWYSPFSTFNDSTLANPVATPSQTTTYIVTIKNDSGCVKTEHVKVWVNPTPKPDTITTSPQRCGSANGSIAVGNISKGTAPFTYTLTNLQTLATSNQQLATFNNLIAGNYQITITDSNNCQWQSDTLVVAEINDITVNFSVYTLPLVFPEPNPLGTAPLTVYTQNGSVNANSFQWTISQQSSVGSSQDTIAQHSTFNISHSFENGGTYDVCLFAYNNMVTCGDTVCKTIVIAPAPDSLVLIVPNVFSPNGDGSNDNFVLQVQSAHLLEKIEVEIFNRWGMLVQSSEFDVQSLVSAMVSSPSGLGAFVLWDGTTNTGKEVPEGTYFYVITYTKLTREKESLKGSVSLLR